MLRRQSACLVCLLLLASALSAETVRLFNGRTLEGWEGDPERWRVENGAIVGEIPKGQRIRKNTWLVWRGGEVADFDLRLKVKLTGAPAANSGIQFRCQVENVDHVLGYQADLDMGATWLGRIYDEHGRALLVERGTRVLIEPNGRRRQETFAPANQFAVLFRENAWNDYRIVAVGEHVAVYVNGTLFSELKDQQKGERDLKGSLAFQLHSGPETRVEFRDVRLERLKPDDSRIGEFSLKPQTEERPKEQGVAPKGPDGKALNLGFESGTLAGWTATGEAFKDQPVNQDGISARWQGQTSNKKGEYFIGGFEIVRDGGVGTLTSAPFAVTHPYASFLIGGGDSKATRVEIVRPGGGDRKEQVVFTAVGNQREQMRRVVADLRKLKGQRVMVRLVDESTGGWGHLNFDDFRFHDTPPVPVAAASSEWRSTRNPILHHLVPNPVTVDMTKPGAETVSKMFVPKGFSVEVIAAEPKLHQPMAFTFDAKGRLWVVEGHCYPQKRRPGKGLDRILIFSDEDGDGSFESRKVFVEGLNLVSGMEVGHGGVWVGAAPQLLFIADADGDDKPDGEPKVLLDGFGFADTHETINSFLWGPDGWLYGNQGVFNSSLIGKPGAPERERTYLAAGVWRYHPVRHEFEVFAHGGSNQWGLDYDEHGQIFMTHCRSFWGRGSTTHVVQGAHYWNQVNGGYARFISARPPSDLPAMRNYMLASARYGHGEGGAGKRGSRQVYGGHSHVGTMIYLGDNWPAEYRNHLFSHNLHGHQLNQQVNVREAGGYNTVHAGRDVLFCADRQYIGVDLQTGPDGAVYISDWYDPRHCHNPNVEHWDRGNGRMYRMKYDATYKPVSVDLASATDLELAKTQLHPNEWHVRAARLVLAGRAERGDISKEAINELRRVATKHTEPARRLRALWTLHVIGAVDVPAVGQLLRDESEYVRAWTIQLAVETLPSNVLAHVLRRAMSAESSLFVRRYLASAVQRVPSDVGWEIADSLSRQSQNSRDRDLPLLLWYGVAGLMKDDLDRALKLADKTRLPALRDYVLWYAAKISSDGRNRITKPLINANADERVRLLGLFELAVRGMPSLPEPQGWDEIGPKLYDSSDRRTRRAAQTVGAAFGDTALYERMRKVLADGQASPNAKRHALSILANDSSPENLPLYLNLLDNSALAGRVIPILSRYGDAKVAKALLAQMPDWNEQLGAAAMDVLSTRPSWSKQVLDAIAAGRIDKSRLSAYFARQMASLNDKQLTERLRREWGSIGQSSAQLQTTINELVSTYQAAPLWAYSEREGAVHFKKLCAACHQPDQPNQAVAPKLAGSGAKGIKYVVENIVDPNAVIGQDYHARLILTADGRVTTGLIEKETDTALTVRTATNTVVIPKEEIEQTKVSKDSFMPVGLLDKLNTRERIELLKYLMSLK